ncbi:unnamed protein product, partial [Polarella glacialis]
RIVDELSMALILRLMNVIRVVTRTTINSAERVGTLARSKTFDNSAGRMNLRASPRKEGKRIHELSMAFDSQVDEIVFGRDMDNSAERVGAIGKSNVFDKSAGRKNLRASPRAEGKRIDPISLSTASEVDEVVFGNDIDNSGERRNAHAAKFEGTAGYKTAPSARVSSQLAGLAW